MQDGSEWKIVGIRRKVNKYMIGGMPQLQIATLENVLGCSFVSWKAKMDLLVGLMSKSEHVYVVENITPEIASADLERINKKLFPVRKIDFNNRSDEPWYLQLLHDIGYTYRPPFLWEMKMVTL